MPRQSFANVITDWEKLLITVTANKDDLGSIDAYRAQLEVEMGGAKAASIRQAALSAEVQQTTRDLEGFLERGRELASRIRTGIRSKYGNRNEKLTEFGMKVQRKRKAAVKVLTANLPPQGVEKPAPQEVTTPDPKEQSQ
jgi:hypothetical protein